MSLRFIVPPLVTPPSHLPNPESLLAFNFVEKKREIFEEARERIAEKAQYTRSGRKPWTQVTVPIPITSSDTTEEEDLAVIWSIMNKSTRQNVKENESGDLTWTLWNCDNYFEWLGIDYKNKKPVDLYVHPAHYETGARKTTVLKNKLRKAKALSAFDEVIRLEAELAQYEENLKSKKNDENDYHWAAYDEINVIYRKKQTKKKQKELQLIVKIRTSYLGQGDPKENNGYLRSCGVYDLLDPDSKSYRILKSMSMGY